MEDVHIITLLEYLKPVTCDLPDSATPITLEDYITELKYLREGTSPGPSIITPSTMKTESLNP